MSPAGNAVRQKGNWIGHRKQTALWSIPSKNHDAHRPRHTEAGGVHYSADAQQQHSGRGHLRAFPDKT
jgi:hypothetical protein